MAAGSSGPQIESGEFLTENGLRLATDMAGDPWKPRLIFVHGGGQSRRSWRHALRNMAGAGFSVVSYDLRGHGDSAWADDGDYSIEAHARDLTAIVRSMPSRPSLVGASFGGRVALATAAQLGPEEIGSLVLVDITPRLASEGLRRVRTFLRLSSEGFDDVQAAARVLERYAERQIGSNYFRLRHSIRSEEDGRVYWRWDPRAAAADFIEPPGMEERLTKAAAELRVPTLLVRGTASDLVTDACVTHFRNAVPAAEVLDIPDGGHLMKTQDLSVFCKGTIEFLRRSAQAA